MKTETLELIRRLKGNAQSAATFFERYKEKTADPNCDKKHAEFNRDNRFTVFRAEVFFSSCLGYYGNSGCSTFGGLDSELVQNHFIKYLNLNKEAIFQAIAKSMSQDAAALVDKASEEVSAMQKMLDEVKAA